MVLDNGLTGIIATNTTTDPDIKARYGERWRTEAGGLSGDDAEFRRIALEKVSHIYKVTGGALEIIGVGGVKDAQTALNMIEGGAKVVQLVTAIRGVGTTVPGRINRGLIELMKSKGYRNLEDARGVSVR